jgi:hypothetical protein
MEKAATMTLTCRRSEFSTWPDHLTVATEFLRNARRLLDPPDMAPRNWDADDDPLCSTFAEARHYLVERFRGERNGVYQHTLWTIDRAIAQTIDTAMARERSGASLKTRGF